MAPYADFLFFGLLLYPVVPTIVLGLFGKANARWTFFVTLLGLAVLYISRKHDEPEGLLVPEIWAVAGFAVYEYVVAAAFIRWKSRATFYSALVLAMAPLLAVKVLPLFSPEHALGFLGISYVTFRALDVVFSVHDKVLTSISPVQYLAYLFFFPTVSSGPIDRYRRFGQDWSRVRGRAEFLDDLDAAVNRLAQGFLYKFLIAALLNTYWVGRAANHVGALATLSYMYAYTLYLFFDFAGYSAFAIGLSRLFGIRTPENFDRPFLSKNIRDFWNRWHISLSFWFRDHIYMRFLLAAGKGKWFKGKHTASYLGLFLTFGIMGFWHGLEWHYILYGLYHAALLSGYDAFARWNKQRKLWRDGPVWRAASIVLTFHAFAFGLLIFSGRLSPHPPPAHDEVAEKIDCHQIVGWVWDREQPNTPLTVGVYIDEAYVAKVVANEPRQDLKDRGFGSGEHGFHYKMPDWVHDGRSHNIELKVVENVAGVAGRNLRGSPETITCPRH